MRHHDQPGLSVEACTNAARSPFSLLADAYGRADRPLRDRPADSNRVGDLPDGQRTADEPGAGQTRGLRARRPALRRLQWSLRAVGDGAVVASILLVIALVGSALASLPS